MQCLDVSSERGEWRLMLVWGCLSMGADGEEQRRCGGEGGEVKRQQPSLRQHPGILQQQGTSLGPLPRHQHKSATSTSPSLTPRRRAPFQPRRGTQLLHRTSHPSSQPRKPLHQCLLQHEPPANPPLRQPLLSKVQETVRSA